MTVTLNFNAVAREIHQSAVEHGWWDEPKRNFAEVIALIHSEASEALEDWRDGLAMDKITIKDDKPHGIPTELADIIIRVLDAAAEYHIDIDDAMWLKMTYNRHRPYKHGRAH